MDRPFPVVDLGFAKGAMPFPHFGGQSSAYLATEYILSIIARRKQLGLTVGAIPFERHI